MNLFVNIRINIPFPREVLKSMGFALGFQHFPRDLANAIESKTIFYYIAINIE